MPTDSSLSQPAILWIALLLLVCAASAAVGVWLVHQRLREFASSLRHLDRIEDLGAALSRLAAERSDLDLRRIEHLLIEMRDNQKRLEDAFLRVAQTPRRATAAEAPAAAAAGGLAERAITRLLALGYERVQLVTKLEELERIGAGDGEILVEARRAGVPCKGRVLVRGGALTDIEMQAAYAAFP